MNRDDLDDIDRLFARLEPIEPKPDFVEAVRAQTTARHSRVWPVWALIDLVASVLLGWAAFDFGRILAIGAWRESGIQLLLDVDLMLAAPTDWLLGLNEVAPFLSLASLILASFAVALATRALLRDRLTPGLQAA